ncbi:homeobox-leucine zipper protein HOX3-like, partial [Hibiscus syriacus]|uniref:homeobox-leucine zipper protein HOX3-like n=1 Tax=Hibiscus syriacus TaxID=106335 RepID=UPI0019233E36
HGGSSHLELTISVPGFASSPSPSPPMVPWLRDFDINQTPGGEDEWITGSIEDEEESCNTDGGASAPWKKLLLARKQSRPLEESFRQNHTLNPKQKEALALQLKLRPRQVEVWFQNRRASKLKQNEMERAYLKRWFGSLTEQNRRLQRELEELRAMKVAPSKVISPHNCEPLPALTLTMCPRCEHVTTTTAALDEGSTKMTVAATPGTTAAALLSKVGTSALQSRPSSAAC